MIRDALVSFLKDACTEAVGIQKEFMLPVAEHRLRTDVAVVMGGSACYIDVVVTNPASISRFRARQFDDSKLVMATIAEKAKIRKYERSYNERNNLAIEAKRRLTFAVEATGTYGNKAKEFITKLTEIKPAMPQINIKLAWARRFVMSKVSVICARARAAQVFLATVRYIQPAQQDNLPVARMFQYELDEDEIEFDNLGDPEPALRRGDTQPE